ncbi:MAG: hypothetical protein AAGA06_05495 [Pseudomonadota bacterium]
MALASSPAGATGEARRSSALGADRSTLGGQRVAVKSGRIAAPAGQILHKRLGPGFAGGFR